MIDLTQKVETETLLRLQAKRKIWIKENAILDHIRFNFIDQTNLVEMWVKNKEGKFVLTTSMCMRDFLLLDVDFFANLARGKENIEFLKGEGI